MPVVRRRIVATTQHAAPGIDVVSLRAHPECMSRVFTRQYAA